MRVVHPVSHTLAIGLLVIFSSGTVGVSGFPQGPQIDFALIAPGVAVVNPNTLSVAIRLTNNSERTAFNVQLESIRLNSSNLLSPSVFPVAVGEIDGNRAAIVQASFTSSRFPAGQQYTLVMEGSYRFQRTGQTQDDKFSVSSVIVLPPGAPGSAPVKRSTVDANKVAGGRFQAQPPRFGDAVNAAGWTVPTTPFVPGKPTTTNTMAQKAPINTDIPPGSAGKSPAAIVFIDNNALGVNSSTTAEPSGASGGGVIFVSANWLAAFSTDGGGTFTQLNPTTVFPNDAVGFCCDQIIQYVPGIDRFIWLLQGNGYRLASARPADIISSGGTAWTYWNLTPNVFGTCSGFDYPDLSVGNNSLYMSWDAGFGGCSSGFQVARTSLAGIQAGGTITIEFTNPSDGSMAWGSHLMQNTLDEIFWAGHNSNSQMRVFSLAEGSGSYFWRDIGISSWANNSPTSLTPDGRDWLAKNFNGPMGNSFPRNGIIGATRSSNRLWFAWSAGTDNFFNQPHVELVTLDRNNNFDVIQQVQIWNNSYAFAYPALATNACTSEVGLSLEFGGNGNYENHVVGFWGDFVVYLTTASSVGTARYGDYVTIRQKPDARGNPSLLFDAFGYGLTAIPPPGAGTRTDLRHIVFGRDGNCQR